jgi:hypothetical protein
VKRTSLRAAASALLLMLACTPDDVAQDSSSSTTTLVPDAPEPDPGPAPSSPGSGGTPCQVDADCDAGTFCELRICVVGCDSEAACDAGEVCDMHGRCVADSDDTAALAGLPAHDERRTELAPGETEARITLRNDGPGVLTYRLAAHHPALTLDPTPAELAPGEEAQLVAAVDLAALVPEDLVLPVQILTSGGGILWSIEPAPPLQAGYFRGAVSFAAGSYGLGSTELALDLDFRADGTIAGRVDTGASLLWPLPPTVTGTWAPAGDVTLELRDLLPAEHWRHSPIARELGRVLVLAGTRTAAGIDGTATETITGLRAEPVEIAGTFTLRRRGPLTGLVQAADYLPKDAAPPTWLAPPGLDSDACDGLGTDYGTDLTLVEPEPACDACAGGNCSPEDRIVCGLALRDAAYNIGDVLAPLAGDDIKPPTSGWTWDDCTAKTPEYNQAGRACLDPAAVRCGDALVRRGSAEYPGPWGEAFRALTAIHATDEAHAAALVSTEAQVDAAFSYKNEIGEPVGDALGRELGTLADDSERLAAALAPMLAPAYPAGLAWIENSNPDTDTARAHLAPLPLIPDYARATVHWSRLAHRAGQNPSDVRAAVRLSAIALHAAAAELHARLAENPAAANDLHALAPALESLRRAHEDLAPDASPFGYAAAYVPVVLSAEDIAHGRTNFEAVHALATDEVAQFGQVADDAWQKARDYAQKTHALETTTLQIETEYNGRLRALCGAKPGETEPAIATCGENGGQIADLRAAVQAAGLRIRHAAQASDNNLYAIAVEEERFAREVEIHLGLSAEIAAAQGRIFQVKDEYGEQHAALVQAEAMAECGRLCENARAESETMTWGCYGQISDGMVSGPTILGVSTPNPAKVAFTVLECDAKQKALQTQTENQCDSVLGQAGLQGAQDQLQRAEEEEIMAINAEIDQAIRDSDLEVRRAASVALIKNLRAEGLLLQIEIEEAELSRTAAMTSLWSAYQEAAALAQEKARALGLLVDDSPDNALTNPHFLQARLEAASRVLPVREGAIRRLYLALRALEYELNQELPALRSSLAAARSPDDLATLLTCLAGIAEDYRLGHGHAQPYVTEVSLRADIFGLTTDVPDVDGSPATPAEQFAALLQDPLHTAPDGTVALPFALSAFENAQFSASLCDDRIDTIEVKLVGDYLGDREAEVLLTRQGLAGVRRCDGADLPQWSAYVPFSFERDELVIQAGVGDFGTAGPNAGFAAWPVHGEQWTLTIPPPSRAPANLDLDVGRISDVILRLHHRARTIAPPGQGTFTPNCG